MDLHKIFIEEATRHSEAALIYPFTTAESAMKKSRTKATHNTVLPDVSDWREAGEILRNTTNFTIVHCGVRDPFFEEIYTRNGHVTALLFAHHPTVQRMTSGGALNEVQVNVTDFPSESNFHLLTLHHLDKTARLTPLVYVLLNGRTADIYAAVFAHLREQLRLLPAVIICDSLQDGHVHASLQLTFPEASVKANWFEYVASLARQLTQVPREAVQGTTHKTILRMVLVLPFLPADYMAPGLEAIRKWMRDKAVDTSQAGPLGRLCKFVETTWLRGVGAGKLSMFRVTIKTYENHMREFHKEVNGCVAAAKGTGPFLWRVIDGLTTIATRVNARGGGEGEKGAAGGGGKRMKKNQILSEAIIRNATEQWITQPIHLRSPLQFLQMATHFITPPFLASVLRVEGGGGDEGEEVEEVEKDGLETVGMVVEAQEAVRNETMGEEGMNNIIICHPPPPAPVIITAREPPPLAFLPQVMDKARETVEMLRKRKMTVRSPEEPPPLAPIIRNK